MRRRKGESYLGGSTVVGALSGWWAPDRRRGKQQHADNATTKVWTGHAPFRQQVDQRLRVWAQRNPAVLAIYVRDGMPPEGDRLPDQKLVYIVARGDALLTDNASGTHGHFLTNLVAQLDPRNDIWSAIKGQTREVFVRSKPNRNK